MSAFAEHIRLRHSNSAIDPGESGAYFHRVSSPITATVVALRFRERIVKLRRACPTESLTQDLKLQSARETIAAGSVF